MLNVEMLAAERGDALLVEYGAGNEATNRILIDGGPVNSGLYEGVRARLMELVPPGPDGRRYFDLLIVSHVDTDHIEGIIRLLQDEAMPCVFDDIWFNGWRHLERIDPASTVAVLGAKQGEFLGALLQHQGRPWNQLLRGGPVLVPETGPLPVVQLRGGLRLTLLSPTVAKLEVLAREWTRVVEAAGFEPGDADTALEQFSGLWWARAPDVPVLGNAPIVRSDDSSEANGSSIAVLAEFGGRTVVLTGDAHDDVLTSSFRRLKVERGVDDDEPFVVDGFKLSHHGSAKNLTPQLLAEVRAGAYLVSSSGDRYDHPDAEAIGALRRAHTPDAEPTVLFNYRQQHTEIWDGKVDARFGPDAVLTLTTDPPP